MYFNIINHFIWLVGSVELNKLKAETVIDAV